MKVLVGYNGSKASRLALDEAARYARAFKATVYIMISMEGGTSEKPEDIRRAAEVLHEAKALMTAEGIPYEISQLVRGMSPGEDLVYFARDNAIDHIFLGIEKTSRLGKLLMGSTAQYIILKAHCPVTTVKP
ncbi:MAG: universal stress protein [Desulfobacterales bacterium]|nr:universal stress protein [Desulfobacterales bacterium]